MNFFEKSCRKIWRLRKSPYLCSPFEIKRHKKFIEKTELLYKKQVPRKNNLSRSVNSFEGIISVRSDWKYINIIQ